MIGTDAFQEADICGITMPITKHNFLVQHRGRHPAGDRRGVPHRRAPAGPARCSSTCRRTCCRRGRRSTGRRRIDLPGYRPVTRPHGKQIREAARLIAAAQRPVLYVGGGVLKAPGHRRAARARRADRHPGRHHADGARRVPGQPPRSTSACPACTASVAAVTALQKSDLLITLGARFDDRVTGKLDTLRPERDDHPRRHRPGRDRQEPDRRRADRRRRPRGAASS